MKSPYSEDSKFVEPTSSRKTGHEVRNQVSIPQSRTLTLNCTCLKDLQGQKWRSTCGKGALATGLNWQSAQGEVPRTDTITEAMEYSQNGPIMIALERSSKHLKESDADIYIKTSFGPCG